MPNHYVVVGLCSRDYSSLDDASLEEYDAREAALKEKIASLQGKDLCQLTYPLPEELMGIVSGINPHRCRNKVTGEYSKSNNGQYGPDWEDIPLSFAEKKDLQTKYGATNWYDWCCKTYGTKWGTYGTTITELDTDGMPIVVQFRCAWGPPNEDTMDRIVAYLRSELCIKDIMWVGHEPEDCSVRVIRYDATNGE